MNFRTATLLVLGMFGSFAIVIATMVFLFWSPKQTESGRRPADPGTLSEETRAEAAPTEARERTAPETPPETTDDARVAPRDRTTDTVTSVPEPDPAPVSSQPRRMAGREAQEYLEVEQKEMKLLRKEMERRLQSRVDAREQKLDRLARHCENMEAGEAVQILKTLDDADLGAVLKRMDREKALQVAALLERLGRGAAITLP